MSDEFWATEYDAITKIAFTQSDIGAPIGYGRAVGGGAAIGTGLGALHGLSLGLAAGRPGLGAGIGAGAGLLGGGLLGGVMAADQHRASEQAELFAQLQPEQQARLHDLAATQAVNVPLSDDAKAELGAHEAFLARRHL